MVSAYAIHGAAPIVGLALLAIVLVAVGFRLAQAPPALWQTVVAWLLVDASILTASRLAVDQAPGARMLIMIAAVLLAMKVVVATADTDRRGTWTVWRWLAFAAAWPGMRPQIFRQPAAAPLPGAARLIRAGIARAAIGVVLVLGARLLWLEWHSLWLATPLLLAGLSLVLHFGLFTIAAGGWRLAGIDCQPLFRAPLAAPTLGEFWSRRWNLAFSEMTATAVYRPLCRHLDRGPARLLAFLFSGALHELAISFPVACGYGLPSLYFLLHGGLVLAEQRLAPQRHAWLGHVWTLTWLALPLPLLFHPAFLAGVVWPLLGRSTP